MAIELTQVLACGKSREDDFLARVQLFKLVTIGTVVVACSGDDDLSDLRQAVGGLDEVFQAFLGREAPHGKQITAWCDAVLVKKHCGLAAGDCIDAVGDENALVGGTAFFHLILVDEDDAVAEAERQFLALAQQPAGRGAPLVVLVVGAVVGQYHGQSRQTQQRCKHAWSDVVDVHQVGTMKKNVHHAQQRVPHGLKALDAGRGKVNVFDIWKGL